MLRRVFLLLFAVFWLLCLPLSVLAEDDNNEDAFIAPTLSPNAIPYDAAHPELLDPDMLYAQSAIVIEADTGDVLFEKDADAIMFPASTTKILTAYIALQMCDLENDLVTISQDAVDAVPATYTRVPLTPGEQVSMKDLIAAMLVRSGNDAANAIAEYISGDVSNFADLMNSCAQMLGCSSDTHFSNPSGVQDSNHYTTARDMALIAQTAMKDERFASFVSKNTYEMAATNEHPLRTVVGGTSILDTTSDYFYNRCTGVKTGFTNAAGYCFVGSASYGGIRLISVVFYSSRSGRWTDTKKLLEYGFTQVETISPELLYAESPRTIDIQGFDLSDSRHGSLTLSIRARDPDQNMLIIGSKEKIDLLRQSFSEVSSVMWTRGFYAPVEQGEVFGTLTYYSESDGIAEYDLVASRSIAARENAPPTLEQIRAYTLADENPLPRFSVDLLVPPAILLLVLILLFGVWLKHRKKRAIKTKVKPLKTRTYTR